MSVSLVNSWPKLSSSALISAKFSMMPLCTTEIRPWQSACGWALMMVGLPCVAQRVWPMPTVPVGMFSFSLAIRRSTLASLLVTLVWRVPSPVSMTATPAES